MTIITMTNVSAFSGTAMLLLYGFTVRRVEVGLIELCGELQFARDRITAVLHRSNRVISVSGLQW